MGPGTLSSLLPRKMGVTGLAGSAHTSAKVQEVATSFHPLPWHLRKAGEPWVLWFSLMLGCEFGLVMFYC